MRANYNEMKQGVQLAGVNFSVDCCSDGNRCERGHGRHISARSVLLPKYEGVFCVNTRVFSCKNKVISFVGGVVARTWTRVVAARSRDVISPTLTSARRTKTIRTVPCVMTKLRPVQIKPVVGWILRRMDAVLRVWTINKEFG
ncbi:uncharacterized protein LOC111356304 [Spodoptera litura]|uniref:Uncharacterized protein LOC111356304 n=1 Tax=Spodoptera litura TaxID=69820 RepID=A0A9J7EAG7_SPOLT|nr:uncharacterized protein LOC111356304 [Spodoptera litura]